MYSHNEESAGEEEEGRHFGSEEEEEEEVQSAASNSSYNTASSTRSTCYSPSSNSASDTYFDQDEDRLTPLSRPLSLISAPPLSASSTTSSSSSSSSNHHRGLTTAVGPPPVRVGRVRAASAVVAGSNATNLSDTQRSCPSTNTSSRHRTAPRSSRSPLSSHSQDGQSEDALYIPSTELSPVEHPAEEIKAVCRAVQSSDWNVRFEALTVIRRLAVCHAELLIPSVKSILRDVKSEVDSLRSLLAKNAIMSLCDLFQNCSRVMENELSMVVPSLLKRSGEQSGQFLAEEAQKALLMMCASCNDQKVLTVLLNAATQGNKVVKMMAIAFVDQLISIVDIAIIAPGKDISRLLRSVCTFCTDASETSRYHAKQCLSRLASWMGKEGLDREIQRHVSQTQYLSVKKILEKGADIDMPKPAFIISPASIAASPLKHSQSALSLSLATTVPLAEAKIVRSQTSNLKSNIHLPLGEAPLIRSQSLLKSVLDTHGNHASGGSTGVAGRGSRHRPSVTTTSSSNSAPTPMTNIQRIRGALANKAKQEYELDESTASIRDSAPLTVTGTATFDFKKRSSLEKEEERDNNNTNNSKQTINNHSNNIISNNINRSQPLRPRHSSIIKNPETAATDSNASTDSVMRPVDSLPSSESPTVPPVAASKLTILKRRAKQRGESNKSLLNGQQSPVSSSTSPPSIATLITTTPTASTTAASSPTTLSSSVCLFPPVNVSPSSVTPTDAVIKAAASPSVPSDALPSIFTELTSNDWRTRISGIRSLLSFIPQYPHIVQQQITNILDPLTAVINDPNSKVIVCTLQALNSLLPALKTALSTSSTLLSTLVTSLAQNLAASNLSVRTLTSDTMDKLPIWWGSHDWMNLIQPYCNLCLYSNPKVRYAMTEKVVSLLTSHTKEPTYTDSPVSLTALSYHPYRYALPVAYQLLSETKLDVRGQLLKLSLFLYQQFGGEIFETHVLHPLKLTVNQAKSMQEVLEIT